MFELATSLVPLCEQQRPFAVATVADVHGSAPRQPGASLVVDATGAVRGSVSGGCVEGAVYEACREAIETGGPHHIEFHRFGYSDDDAFAAGLTCGGSIDILIRRIDPSAEPEAAAVVAAAAAGAAAALATVVRGPARLIGRRLAVHADGLHSGGTGDAAWDAALATAAASALCAGTSTLIDIQPEGEPCGEPVTVWAESSAPPPRMLIFGAVDYAGALSQLGSFLGFQVTVCDARAVFTTKERFPYADHVVVDWPHRYLEKQSLTHRDVICALTHDPKFDLPLLERALRLPVAYVGAMGSANATQDRLERLRAAGLNEAELSRLRAPIGLQLGGRTPQETAVAIAAEIIAVAHDGSGTPLRAGSAIHPHPGPQKAQGAPMDGGLPDRPFDAHPALVAVYGPGRTAVHFAAVDGRSIGRSVGRG
ncbi:protein of unknown function DUF182 [Streptomyces davaonensis JCM 4913]|uniref:Xanthine dehydrogenase n=1 Tax=Streptomyces davaonensis (strain DSM 101723 / JCM 4913 / KCC S-0913 / 768) TaxID=1214101 RepID=K4R073_STRDJ|nr:XdhC/CoxI family protein [Streptomyces davaonensis]CCK26034.1 protein of unknown function DUF182 [Streptomyces davaonensis JCM 4913]